ncbi:MAG TPA: DUF5996 family protein [Candidatus Binatia bacterium]|nr:DUF5996 family protein [Candidatus Binatia bacterium]
MATRNRSTPADWPDLVYAEGHETWTTLHLWTQVVGKVRLVQTPWVNHSWHVPLYLTARGLTTSTIPFDGRTLEMEFDFVGQRLALRTGEGAERALPLVAQPVSDFYRAVMDALSELDMPVRIHTTPNEIADAVPFERDLAPRRYQPEHATRLWRALLEIDRVLKEFRARFIGKCSPVHFFWGSFDLAVTRFSGREAPSHPGGVPNFPDWVAREAYSHEVSSAGFWPGGGAIEHPAFYSYAYPAPPGFADARVEPAAALWSKELGEFVLPYDAVRAASSPDDTLLAFLQSTYEAAADLGRWPRAALERELPPPHR